MQKAIDLIKKISKDLSKNYKEELWEYNMPETFANIYFASENVEDANRIICFIVYAYSPDSLWLDLNKDRTSNKLRILHNLGADTNNKLYQEIIDNKSELAGMAIFDFLEGLKSWRWRAIFDLLDYSSKMFRFASQETESDISYQKMNKDGEVKDIKETLDIDTISKVNKEKGLLLNQAIEKRKHSDLLLEEIKKQFVATDTATQADFDFTFTDTSKKRDIMSWRGFILDKNEKAKRQS